jgi:hypothetical protein
MIPCVFDTEMASLFAPRNVILAAVAAYALAVGAAALERRAAGVDADALVAAAIAISGAPADRAAAMESFMRPMMANYPIVILIGVAIGWPLLTTIFFLGRADIAAARRGRLARRPAARGGAGRRPQPGVLSRPQVRLVQSASGRPLCHRPDDVHAGR